MLSSLNALHATTPDGSGLAVGVAAVEPFSGGHGMNTPAAFQDLRPFRWADSVHDLLPLSPGWRRAAPDVRGKKYTPINALAGVSTSETLS